MAEHTDEALEQAPAEEVLAWAARTFPADTIAVASAFGPGTAVVIHMLAQIAPRMPVIFIDTLHHFPETITHVQRVTARYNLDLRVYRPAPSLAAFEAQWGERLWERDLDAYQRIAKVEPFQAATAPLAAWITGRRRDQASSRLDLPVVDRGEKVRINPLASWTRADVWRFILEHDLPYNPLHDQGYTSIGDRPLTTPVRPGEDERAGRWRGAGRTECGIHETPDPAPQASPS